VSENAPSTSMSEGPAWVDRDQYPFESYWVELAPGQRMHYVDEGAADVLLFLHGTPTWSFEWRHLIRDLSERYRCIAPDLIGMGLSDRPTDFAYTPEAHADAVAAFVRKLGLARFSLVLHDFGGPIGLPLVIDTPERVQAVVLTNTWAWSFADDPLMARRAQIAGGRLGRFLYRWLNVSLKMIMPGAYGDVSKLTPAIHRQYLAVFPDRKSRGLVLWGFARSLLGSSAYYDRLWQRLGVLREKPVLIVWGMLDSAFQPPLLQRWIAALPDARVVELQAGHWPHEEAPDEVRAAIETFLREK
jgi:pimeloyl-ACP methyl ester carboxylesterase